MLHHEQIQPMTTEEMEQKLQQMKEERQKKDSELFKKHHIT